MGLLSFKIFYRSSSHVRYLLKLSISPIMQECLGTVLRTVKERVTAPHCILLKENNLLLAVRLQPLVLLDYLTKYDT